MEIKDLMNPSVVTIEPTASAALAARLLSRHNVGSLPVCGGGPPAAWDGHRPGHCPAVRGGGGGPGPDPGAGHYDPGVRLHLPPRGTAGPPPS